MNKNAPRTASYWVSRIVLVFLIVTTFFPFVMLINMSLKPTVLITTDFLGLPKEPYWQNFSKALSFVGRPILNSFLICGASLGFILLHVSLSGYAFARLRFKGKRFLFGMLVAVMMVPTTITIVPQYLIMQKLRLINKYWALILPSVAAPMNLFLMRQSMTQVPDAMIEAAKVDGAGMFRICWQVVMPNQKPALMTVIIFSFQAAWNIQGGTLVFSESLKTLPTVVQQAASAGLARAGVAMAAAVFMLVPPIVIFMLAQRQVIETMAHSGIKD